MPLPPAELVVLEQISYAKEQGISREELRERSALSEASFDQAFGRLVQRGYVGQRGPRDALRFFALISGRNALEKENDGHAGMPPPRQETIVPAEDRQEQPKPAPRQDLEAKAKDLDKPSAAPAAAPTFEAAVDNDHCRFGCGAGPFTDGRKKRGHELTCARNPDRITGKRKEGDRVDRPDDKNSGSRIKASDIKEERGASNAAETQPPVDHAPEPEALTDRTGHLLEDALKAEASPPAVADMPAAPRETDVFALMYRHCADIRERAHAEGYDVTINLTSRDGAYEKMHCSAKIELDAAQKKVNS